jgi:hypothetical protein
MEIISTGRVYKVTTPGGVVSKVAEDLLEVNPGAVPVDDFPY